jgi:hypothetical protein
MVPVLPFSDNLVHIVTARPNSFPSSRTRRSHNWPPLPGLVHRMRQQLSSRRLRGKRPRNPRAGDGPGPVGQRARRKALRGGIRSPRAADRARRKRVAGPTAEALRREFCRPRVNWRDKRNTGRIRRHAGDDVVSAANVHSGADWLIVISNCSGGACSCTAKSAAVPRAPCAWREQAAGITAISAALGAFVDRTDLTAILPGLMPGPPRSHRLPAAPRWSRGNDRRRLRDLLAEYLLVHGGCRLCSRAQIVPFCR